MLVAMRALGKNRRLMGELGNGRLGDALALGAMTIVFLSVVGLAASALLWI